MKMLEKIRGFFERDEGELNYNILECYLKNLAAQNFRQGDIDVKEIILINVFPDLRQG